MEETIRLFKALPIEKKSKKKPNKELLAKTIPLGFIFSPEVVSNYSNYDELIDLVKKEIGLTGEQMNSTFHKSWAKVRDSSMEQLVMEQIIHYFTTYGFEELGIYSESSVYIPNEKLEVPELEENIPLTIIRGYTKEELKTKLLDLLSTGIALKEDTIKDVIEVAEFVELTGKEVETIKNKQVKIELYEELGLIPENPIEFIRYLVCSTTGKTLVIKTKDVLEEMKEANGNGVLKLFKEYEKLYGLEKLSSVFYRYKPFFLVCKQSSRLNQIINKIRKLAKKYHKPMKEDFLNNITAKIKRKEVFSVKELKEALSKVNTFRKSRLAYALRYRLKDPESILYRIRNGKSYATEFKGIYDKKILQNTLKIVLASIEEDISKNVKGKKIFIPENLHYTLPTTEKQFTGDLPSGTYVSIPKDMVAGIYWENLKNYRVDLDLSLTSIDGKLGWDSYYRSEDTKILFSGDITDAPQGATELFYVRRQHSNAHLMHVNYYNYDENKPVQFKIMVAKEQVSNLKQNYTINPNNIICFSKSKIDQKHKVLGLLVTTTNECRFYFTETYMGNSITSSNNDNAEHTRKYLLDFYKNSISLNKIFENAGAELVDHITDADIDLSPENLEKDTIINLLGKKK